MATTIPETIKNPEAFLAEIEKDIPDTTIITAVADPTVIAPITLNPVTTYGTLVETEVSYNQTASTSQKEETSSKTLRRSVQTNIQQAGTSTQTENGGDTKSTVKVRPSISFSLSIPISIQPY